jgi:hypothetical protein
VRGAVWLNSLAGDTELCRHAGDPRKNRKRPHRLEAAHTESSSNVAAQALLWALEQTSLHPLGENTMRFTFTVAALAVSACGPQVTEPTVPDAIKAPLTEKVVMKVFAKGTQNYTCQADSAASSGYAFKLVAPDATLYNGENASAPVAGKHYAGPTWEATEGSKFVGDGASAQRADAPEATAIPWLLIPKKEVSGTGEFSKFTYAQRVATTGGKAPSTGCDASHLGEEAKIEYTASYFFYEKK